MKLENMVDMMTKKIIYSLCGLCVFVAMLALSGCATKPVYKPVHKLTLAERRLVYIHELRDNNVQVIQLGETLRFVMFSDDLFHPDSANLYGDYRQVLVLLAELINTYDKIDVKVAAYTDNIGDVTRQQALTTRQAQVIASFLSEQGIDARMTYAVGYNRRDAVDWNGSASGRHNNRRVEVSFRFYPEYVPYG
jgi:intracellular multiplication protein IcmN